MFVTICNAQGVAQKWQTTGNYGVGQSAYIGTADTTHLSFGVNGSEKARINNAGLFGIGTANPTQKLQVHGRVYSDTLGFKFPDGTTQTTAATGSGTVTSVATGYGILGGTIITTGTLKADTTHLPSGNGLFTQYDFASRTGTMAAQNANSVSVTGGTINGTSIGATTRSTGNFTTLSGNTVTSTTPVLSFNGANTIASFGTTTAGSYNQLIIQNKSNSIGASTNYVVSNNLGTDTSYYGEFGMNSSSYSSGTPTDFFSLNNNAYFSAHGGDITLGSGNGFKTYLAWGTKGQSAHVINASGAIGLNTNLAATSGTTNFGSAGQVLTSQGNSSSPTWTTVSAAPAGSTTQLQVNVSGALGAYSNLTTDGTTLFQSNQFTGTYNNANCAAVFGSTGAAGAIRIGQTGYISSYYTGGNVGLQFMSTSGNFYFFNNGYNGGTSNVILDASGGATGSILSGVKTLSSWNGMLSIDHIAPNGGNYFRIRTENGTPSLTERFTIDVGGSTVPANLINANFNVGGSTVITPNSTLQVTGSIAYLVTQKTGNYTATINDNTIEYTSGTATLTLPTAVGINGREYKIVNAGGGTITIATTLPQTFINAIGTPTSLTMATMGTYIVQSDNANWMVISKY